MNELLSCPFCEAKNIQYVATYEECPWMPSWAIAVICPTTDGGCGASSIYAASAEQAIAAWNARAPVNEWISVEDKLPDVGEEVLVFTSSQGICVDYRTGLSHRDWGYYDVTHWKPLPAPPHETTENKV